MKINAISKGSGQASSDALVSLALAAFYGDCVLAPYAEFYTHRGNADAPRKVDNAFTAGTTRALSADYTSKNRAPQFGATSLKIYGDQVETDIAYERRGIDIGSQRAKDLRDFATSFGRHFTDAMINHTGAADGGGNLTVKGLAQLASENAREATFDTADGGEVPTGNGNTERKQQDKFIEFLMSHINDIAGGPSCMIMNGWLQARLASLGRGYLAVQSVRDPFTGQNLSIPFFGNVPIVNAGFKADGTTEIITKTEDCGASAGNCTSLYLVRFGEERDFTIATNVGLDAKDLGLVGQQYTTMLELDMDTALLNTKAIKRLKGIIL